MRKYLFIINLSTSAFLLFQIQPIIAKTILPFFGGGASVWTACMLFFQGLLLLGYLHAYSVSLLKNLKWQWLIQVTLLILSLAAMPLLLKPSSLSIDSGQPQLNILILLLTQIGLPFFLLSSTSILLQHWYARQTHKLGATYSLYSWSNLGSLTALVSYPFLIENNFTILTQKIIWLFLYSCFVLNQLSLIWWLYCCKSRVKQLIRPETLKNKVEPIRILQWLAFAATGCMVLLGTTQMLTLNISPMPFLWVLPLGIYLVSYILVFSGFQFYVRIYYYPLFGFCLIAALLMFFLGSQFSSLSQILMYLFILFISCMICHGELRLLAPHTDNLPLFYLVVAAGGLVGSLFVSLWAPAIFTSLTEYPIAIFCVYIMAASSIRKKHRKHDLIWTLGLFTLPVAYLLLHNAYSRFDIANTRNFYGYLSVKDVATEQGVSRRLVDGSTLHGSQSMQTTSSSTVGYYAENTGISIAIQHSQQQANMQMAVIGLGAGVLAKYGREGDAITFYEINPAVKNFAQTYFTYLADSPADIDITLGDGRMSLQNKLTHSPASKLDILVIDAFTSDAIPIHLLTYEAFQLYWQHLKENGLLVMHISNNHLDLKSVIYTLGKEFNKQSLFFKTYQTSTTNYGSEWMVITSNKSFVSTPAVLRHAIKFEIKDDAKFHWTDDFSSVLSVLKL